MWAALTAVAALALGAASPAAAKTDLFVSKRFYSVISGGLGVYFLTEANRARGDANEAYEQYQLAGTTARARELYDESRQKDTKAAVLLALGVGSLGYAVHLWLSGDSDKLPDPKLERGLVQVRGVAVDVGGDAVTRRLGVHLRRGF
jgi:hypothetical protein